MSVTSWKRPDLPPGPLRDLNECLHELRERSGLSSRQIARAMRRRHGTAPSHTTIHQLFTQPRLQPAELVLRVADALLAAQRSLAPGASEPVLDLVDQLWQRAASQARRPASAVPAVPTVPAMLPVPTVPPPVWQVVPLASPAPGSGLNAVVAVDSGEAWAVGYERHSRSRTTPLILRWDGRLWARVPLTGLDGVGGLQLVAADSSDNVWAVARNHPDPDDVRAVTAVLRFDGDGWQEVPYPPGNAVGHLNVSGLAVVGGHAWLIGSESSRVVISESDGRSWREHHPPAPCQPSGFTSRLATFCNLVAVAAFAPDDIWACGFGMRPGFLGPLLLRWDGRYWHPVEIDTGGSPVVLTAVAGRSSRDLWVVGHTTTGPDGRYVEPASFVLHGDGTSWHRVPGLPPVVLVDVTTDAAGRPWLIHGRPEPTSTIATYDSGTGSWVHMFAPGPPGTVGVDLLGIAAVPGCSTMFAVGAGHVPGAANVRTPQAVILACGGAGQPAARSSRSPAV